MTSVARVNRWAALLVGGMFVACAPSRKVDMLPPNPAPAAPVSAEREPQTLAEAEASLERAREELSQLGLGETHRSAATTSAPAPEPSAPEPSAHQRRAEEAAAEPAPQADRHCQNACRAFSSLARATESVCRLDAEDGKRCERARRIRDDASQRVAGCGCVQ